VRIADTRLVLRSVIAAVVLLAVPSTAAAPASAGATSKSALERVIVPGVGIGGIKLGTSQASVHARLGTAQMTGDGNLFDEYYEWGVPNPRQPLGPLDNLSVSYPYQGHNALGGTAFLATSGAWSIAGTGAVSGRQGDVALLRRVYGPLLKGPYIVGPATGKDGSSRVYYELPGRYQGRTVHTLFDTTTLPAYANEILEVSVSFCQTGPLNIVADDVPCHATK
jgi:hypothetical protein